VTTTAAAPLPTKTAPTKVTTRSAARQAEAWAGIILASPALVIFTIFMFVPIVLTFWYSLHRYSGFGSMKWLGLQNYQNIISDPTFWQALRNTVVFTLISVPVGMALGLGAAMLLNKVLPGRALFRALIYIPVVVSGVAAAIIFLRLFDPLLGVINQVMSSIGLPTADWQGNGTAAFASVIIVVTWQGIGFGMVVYLAGLQGIPREMYEAAAVDGASGRQVFRRITWPLLAPTTVFLAVYSGILSFQVFDVVFVLTSGGPGTSTTFLVQYAYDQGFTQRHQGYAAAIGVIIYFIVLALTVVWWRLSSRRDKP
jgi:multiple sugar transport system permease protein